MRDLSRRSGPALAVALLLCTVSAGIAEASPEDEYTLAVTTILCDCGCHPQSVHDCACGRAAEMRDEMRGMIGQGMTGEAVIAAYVAQHGEQIRIAPTVEGFNLLAWLGPLAALILAGGGLVLVLRRWTRNSAAPTSTAPPPAVPADDPYLTRLDRDVKDLQ